MNCPKGAREGGLGHHPPAQEMFRLHRNFWRIRNLFRAITDRPYDLFCRFLRKNCLCVRRGELCSPARKMFRFYWNYRRIRNIYGDGKPVPYITFYSYIG